MATPMCTLVASIWVRRVDIFPRPSGAVVGIMCILEIASRGGLEGCVETPDGVYVVGENSVAHRPAKGGGGTAEAGEGGAQGPRRLRAGGPAAARRVPRCTSSTSQHATCGAAPAANSPRHIVRRLPAPQRRHGPQPRRRSRRHSSLRAAPRSRRGPPPISSRVPPSTCLVARRRQVKGPSSGPRRGCQAWPQ